MSINDLEQQDLNEDSAKNDVSGQQDTSNDASAAADGEHETDGDTKVPFFMAPDVSDLKLLETATFTAPSVINYGADDVKDKAPEIPVTKANSLEATPAPEVVKVTEGAPVVEEMKTETVSDFNSLISKLTVDATPNQKSLLRSLAVYMDKLAPGKFVEGDDGARAQYNFWRAIRFIIEEAPQEEFRRLYAILLAFFQEYKNGVFDERYVFRFSEFWHQDPKELAQYQVILNIIKLTCDPEQRAAGLKQVSLARSMDAGFSEQGRQRIMTFYGN